MSIFLIEFSKDKINFFSNFFFFFQTFKLMEMLMEWTSYSMLIHCAWHACYFAPPNRILLRMHDGRLINANEWKEMLLVQNLKTFCAMNKKEELMIVWVILISIKKQTSKALIKSKITDKYRKKTINGKLSN